MRILHLDSGREMRGGQWQVLRLHKGLVEAGVDSLLLARAESPLAAATRAASLPCADLTPLRLARLSPSYHLVHAHDARAHALASICSVSPFVVSRRVAFAIRQGALSRWKYRRATRYLAVSRFVAAELERGGIPAGKIDIVYDGVPVPDQPATGNRLLTPYSTDPGKCMHLAQQAAAHAGVPLELSRDLEQDLPSASGLIYLSLAEGLGSGILLAMAHGVTVIASNTGGIPELLEDGVTGFLTANTATAVAEAIHKASTRNSDRRFGAAARLRVMERFTVPHMVAATRQSYRRALEHA